MPEQTEHQTLEFVDDKGNVTARMRIFPPPALTDAILRLDDSEARRYDEEPLQIREGCRYEYDLESLTEPKLHLALANDFSGEIITPSRVPGRSATGQIVPGLRTGRLGLEVINEEGNTVGSAGIEIFSNKIGYRDDYHQMMEDITDQCVSLLMELRSPTALKFIPEPCKSAETIHQQFAFLRSLLGSRHFRNALHRISSHPHRRWEPEESICDTCRGFRPNAQGIRQLARGARRTPLPTGHPLRERKILSSIPQRITLYHNVQTDDTPENRFIKFALKTFSGFFNKMRHALEEKGNGADAKLRTEIKSLEIEIESALSAEIFRGISDPDMLPLGSPVLQRKEGYREVLQAWLKFDMAARLVWHGGEDVYGAGQRDIATLYEYWVFFKLLDIVSEVFELAKPAVEELIEKTADGFGLKLKSGQYLPIHGSYASGARLLNVQFSYNRSFSFSKPHTSKGTWSRIMRPDYTLSLWPDDFTEDEAEAQELMVHVHFDAKYRIENITELFGSEDESLGEEKTQQREGRYKRGDLLKMHAYRDAIRRTQGAYVLYPGTESKQWSGYHEILPGLGAFPIRPGNGDEELERFIRLIVDHLCDRATARERQSYHTFFVNQEQVSKHVICGIGEKDPESDIRHLPLAETYVLVGMVRSDEHLAWIRDVGIFDFGLDVDTDSSNLGPETTGARYLLLVRPDGKTIPGLFNINQQNPKLISKSGLKSKGYPGEPEQDLYMIFEVSQVKEFNSFTCDQSKLSELKDGIPYAVTLLSLIAELRPEYTN